MKDQHPYRASRAELRAIDEALREKKPAPARLVRAVLERFQRKRQPTAKTGACPVR